jgi:NAD(P)H dehydrogenase (quinone)
MSVIVTGASGKLGRMVAENLMDRLPPAELVLVSRHPEALRDLSARGADVRYGNFDEPHSLSDAFAGGDRMLLISTDAVGHRFTQHRAAIDAAVAAGVGHVVYTSHPHPGAGNPLGQVAEEHGETEEMLHDSGITWTVLRFGTFAELQVQPAALAVAAGKLVTNGGAGRIVPISRRDCAEAAAVVLTTSGHGGKTYDITGPESLSQSDLAAIYGEVSGRSVKVVPIGDKMLVMGLVLHGTPRPVARAIADFGRAVREGYFDVVDPAFEGLCGRPPVSLREVLIPHRGDLLEVA